MSKAFVNHLVERSPFYGAVIAGNAVAYGAYRNQQDPEESKKSKILFSICAGGCAFCFSKILLDLFGPECIMDVGIISALITPGIVVAAIKDKIQSE